MGHRDIWGKNPSKWKKQCPCFDAEKEYADLDDIKLDKYDDAGAIEEPKINENAPAAQYETYVLDHPRDYSGFMDKMMPFA